MSTPMPDFKSADDREAWIIKHADFFSIILRRDRRNYRWEAESLYKARQAARRMLEADPTARFLIYAVAGNSDTFVEVIATKEAKRGPISKDPQLQRGAG